MCYTIINFFILFYRPAKTDVCDTCTELELAIGRGGPNLARLQARLQAHKEEAREQKQQLKYCEQQCPIDAQNEDTLPFLVLIPIKWILYLCWY